MKPSTIKLFKNGFQKLNRQQQRENKKKVKSKTDEIKKRMNCNETPVNKKRI